MAEGWRKYSALKTKKGRQQSGLFLIEGYRLAREALISPLSLEACLVTGPFLESEHWPEIREHLRLRNLRHQVINQAAFKRLADTETPQGILLVARQPGQEQERINLGRKKLLLLLEGVRDPGNLGTLIRTADWFGVNVVLLSPDCVDPYNPKVVRASMGSLFYLPVVEVEDFLSVLDQLKASRFLLVGTSPSAQRVLEKTQFRAPVAVVLGGEAQGLSPEVQHRMDFMVRIWKYGQAESLNVAIAGGVTLHWVAGQIFRFKSKAE
ncbi:MAG: RNA methyltransferase [Calditrichaeota bacterium]|nr:MAG: RNA methyltransferase [Calditrichota bacterium]